MMRDTFFQRSLHWVLLAVCLLGSAPSWAERADRDKPLTLEADSASYDDLKQVYKLSGKVVLTKGTMVLRASSAEVRVDPEGYQYATALSKGGELAYLRQKRDGLNQFIEGNAERIDYDGKLETAKLTGKARLARLEGTVLADEIRGNVLSYDSKNEFYTASGAESGNGGRVRAVLAPRKPVPQNAGSTTAAPLELRPSPKAPE